MSFFSLQQVFTSRAENKVYKKTYENLFLYLLLIALTILLLRDSAYSQNVMKMQLDNQYTQISLSVIINDR